MPKQSGGVFVQGGTIGNLSALVVARDVARKKNKDRLDQIRRWVVVASAESHASIKSAADVMDVQLLLVKPNQDGVLTGELCEQTISDFKIKNPGHEIFAIVATAGSTNLGIIDDLKSVGDLAKKLDIWFHIDGAYGLAALCSPTTRKLFSGVEMCDSFIVDPHKWLFAPFDACALIYRNPRLAKAAHIQKASYLDPLEEDKEWNPSDYAIHLTRRARGLPFWFSLAAHGTDEYAKAMDKTMETAKQAAELIKKNANLKLLLEPQLSIVAFERVGWKSAQYQEWSDKLLKDQIGFVTPSAHNRKPILRFAIVNPWTNISDIEEILATL